MSHLTPPSMRCFILRRDRDITGTSGVGIVAEGCVFSNGEVWMHWLTPTSSTTRFACIEDVETIHGHGGDTRVEWIDQDPDEVADATAIDASDADPGESIRWEQVEAELGLDDKPNERLRRAVLRARDALTDVPAGHTQLDVQAGGIWHPCCPALLALGLDCAATPRRPGGPDHSHDHLIAWRSGQAPESEPEEPNTDPVVSVQTAYDLLEHAVKSEQLTYHASNHIRMAMQILTEYVPMRRSS